MTLRPTGDSGFYVVTAHLFRGIEGEILHQERTWANEGHVAFENVPQLGELVQGRVTDKSTETRYAQFVGEEVPVGVFALVHGFELDNAERSTFIAWTLLKEEDTGAVVEEVEEEGHDEEDGAEEDEGASAHGDVYEALDVFTVHVGKMRWGWIDWFSNGVYFLGIVIVGLHIPRCKATKNCGFAQQPQYRAV